MSARPNLNDSRPEHFDATAYKPNGSPTSTGISGRRSKLSTEQAEQIAFLLKVIRVAEKDLDDYLYASGFKTVHGQQEIVRRIRKGWRPR